MYNGDHYLYLLSVKLGIIIKSHCNEIKELKKKINLLESEKTINKDYKSKSFKNTKKKKNLFFDVFDL